VLLAGRILGRLFHTTAPITWTVDVILWGVLEWLYHQCSHDPILQPLMQCLAALPVGTVDQHLNLRYKILRPRCLVKPPPPPSGFTRRVMVPWSSKAGARFTPVPNC